MYIYCDFVDYTDHDMRCLITGGHNYADSGSGGFACMMNAKFTGDSWSIRWNNKVYCDGGWYNNNGIGYLITSASASNGSQYGGAFVFDVDSNIDHSNWNFGWNRLLWWLLARKLCNKLSFLWWFL